MGNGVLDLMSRCTRRINREADWWLARVSLRRRGIRGAASIHTFTSPEELSALFWLARRCPIDGRALEIGSYLGASTCFIGAGMRGQGAALVCIDTWRNETMGDGLRDTHEEFMQNVAGIRALITTVRSPSSSVAAASLGASFDLVFLDGDHSYEQVRQDFALVSTCVKPGGIIVFHDSACFEGVSRVIGEALTTGRWQLVGVVGNMCWIRAVSFEK